MSNIYVYIQAKKNKINSEDFKDETLILRDHAISSVSESNYENLERTAH